MQLITHAPTLHAGIPLHFGVLKLGNLEPRLYASLRIQSRTGHCSCNHVQGSLLYHIPKADSSLEWLIQK